MHKHLAALPEAVLDEVDAFLEMSQQIFRACVVYMNDLLLVILARPHL